MTVSLFRAYNVEDMSVDSQGSDQRTNRKLDTPEKTFDLNSHVVNQEFSNKKGTEGLAGKVMGQQPPILSNVPALDWKSALRSLIKPMD